MTYSIEIKLVTIFKFSNT